MLKTAEDIRKMNEQVSHAGLFAGKLRSETEHIIPVKIINNITLYGKQ